MNCRQRLEGYLRENGAPFEVQHHARAISAQEVAATEHVPGKMFANCQLPPHSLCQPDERVALHY